MIPEKMPHDVKLVTRSRDAYHSDFETMVPLAHAPIAKSFVTPRAQTGRKPLRGGENHTQPVQKADTNRHVPRPVPKAILVSPFHNVSYVPLLFAHLSICPRYLTPFT